MQHQQEAMLVQVQPKIISAEKARQRANGWLTMNMGHLLHAEAPRLLLTPTFQLCWQVNIILTTPRGERLGEVGLLQLNAVTGQILSDVSLYNNILDKAYVQSNRYSKPSIRLG